MMSGSGLHTTPGGARSRSTDRYSVASRGGGIRSSSSDRGRASVIGAARRDRSRSGGSTGGASKSRSASVDSRRSIARSSVVPKNLIQRAPDFRTERNANIKELLEFLAGTNFPMDMVSPKILQCPSSRIVLLIFEFLIKFLDEGYINPEIKYEETIPHILKSIGYPYTISKSALLSIAPHTWPLILHSLVWLIQQINQAIDFNWGLPAFAQHVAAAYSCGNSDTEELEGAMRQAMLGETEISITSLRATHAKHLRDLERFVTDAPDTDEVLAANDRLSTQIRQLEKYNTDASTYHTTKQDMLEKLNTELEENQTKQQEQQVERDALELEYKSQKLTAADIEELKSRDRVLRNEFSKETEKLHELQEKIGGMEVQLRQSQNEGNKLKTRFEKQEETLKEQMKVSKNDYYKSSADEITEKTRLLKVKTDEHKLRYETGERQVREMSLLLCRQESMLRIAKFGLKVMQELDDV